MSHPNFAAIWGQRLQICVHKVCALALYSAHCVLAAYERLNFPPGTRIY
ncbi:MAG: hypothetical protein ACI81Q_000705 [Paracoccaceae bacterium]|jgi:hypothetical protein